MNPFYEAALFYLTAITQILLRGFLLLSKKVNGLRKGFEMCNWYKICEWNNLRTIIPVEE